MKRETKLALKLEFRKYVNYLGPSLSVGAGVYVGIQGLAEIVQDIVMKYPIDTSDKIITALGAGTVMVGIGLLKKAESEYRK